MIDPIRWNCSADGRNFVGWVNQILFEDPGFAWWDFPERVGGKLVWEGRRGLLEFFQMKAFYFGICVWEGRTC